MNIKVKVNPKQKNVHKKLKGFVMNKDTGHPSLPYYQNGDIVKAVDFSHNPNTKFDDRVELLHNIDPKDTESKSYAKKRVSIKRSSRFREKKEYRDYRIHPDDKPTIDNIIQSNGGKSINKKDRRNLS